MNVLHVLLKSGSENQMRYYSSPPSAYPLLTASNWPRKKCFLKVPFKGLHVTTGSFLNLIHTCRAKMVRVIAKNP